VQAAALDAVALYGTEHGERAFQSLMFETYETVFRRVLKRGVEAHTAEGLVWEGALRAYLNLPKYNTSQPFLPWFWTIVRNLANSYDRAIKGRGKKPRPVDERITAEHLDAVGSRPDAIDSQIDYERWLRAKSAQDQLFLNSLMEGCSVTDAARRLDKSASWGYGVKTRLMAEVKRLLGA
jgi:DNA-directed RNA polymerase specialized sigma24 family protein